MEHLLLSVLLAICLVLLVLALLNRKSKGGNELLERAVRDEFRTVREDSAKAFRQLREEISAGQKSSIETLVKTMSEMSKSQTETLESVGRRIKDLTESNEVRIERVRSTIDTQLKNLQESNEKKLNEMRQTVDEKLHNTLEKRLGESFKLVSERLEAVQHGLGEMQNLAAGVGDLKRVLSNVKTRGTWGEVQLGALLEQILTPDQYARNVQIQTGSEERVDYAIRLPGPDAGSDSHIWLPIDSKFPQEDYLRLLDASDAADTEAVQKAIASLLRAVHGSAKDICKKYLNPPRTTDFAIMFLPTEGLYAEVLRQPGQVEQLQREYRVVVAGPTNLAAILNSLRMGFQTLAIGKRSHEVWTVLAAVKTEFGKFGDVLDKVKRQLNTAANTIDQTQARTRAMAKKLRDVEQLPGTESVTHLRLEQPTTPDTSNAEDES